MSIRAVLFGQQDTPGPEIWDQIVARDPRGHLLQTWAWGDLKAAFGWRPYRLAIETDQGYVAGAQVLYRPIGPLCAGYVPKGPFLAHEEPEIVTALWDSIHTLSRRQRAIWLKIEPPWGDEDAAHRALIQAAGFSPGDECVQPRRTIVVDLSVDEDKLLARMKSKWRYNIRLSSRKGVVVKELGPEGIDTFYDLMRITGQRDGFGIHSRDYYRRALELFQPLGRATLLIAYLEETPLAGLMPFAFNGQAWYMYGASSNEHREKMPNHLLQWRAMQWAREKGCREYDLWGIPDAENESAVHALTGVGRFKQGIGGDVVRFLGAYDYVYHRPFHRAARAGLSLLRKLRQGYD